MRVSSASVKKFPNPENAFTPRSFPKVNAKPNIQKPKPPNMTSTAFFTIMFASFFLETIPKDTSISDDARSAIRLSSKGKKDKASKLVVNSFLR